MKMKTLTGVTVAISIQTVADNRHTEARLRSCVHSKLMGSSRKGMKYYTAPTILDTDEFVIRHSLLSHLCIHTLSRAVKNIGRKRKLHSALAPLGA